MTEVVNVHYAIYRLTGFYVAMVTSLEYISQLHFCHLWSLLEVESNVELVNSEISLAWDSPQCLV